MTTKVKNITCKKVDTKINPKVNLLWKKAHKSYPNQ